MTDNKTPEKENDQETISTYKDLLLYSLIAFISTNFLKMHIKSVKMTQAEFSDSLYMSFYICIPPIVIKKLSPEICIPSIIDPLKDCLAAPLTCLNNWIGSPPEETSKAKDISYISDVEPSLALAGDSSLTVVDVTEAQ